eukprot:GFYU01008867.1.p1 GENE.GFYU01008867.1~~GFYU01008867.1.p1  ORF type:complete len:241 (-),score=42.20 GFYU01008867.1:107-829(-)
MSRVTLLLALACALCCLSEVMSFKTSLTGTALKRKLFGLDDEEVEKIYSSAEIAEWESTHICLLLKKRTKAMTEFNEYWRAIGVDHSKQTELGKLKKKAVSAVRTVTHTTQRGPPNPCESNWLNACASQMHSCPSGQVRLLLEGERPRMVRAGQEKVMVMADDGAGGAQMHGHQGVYLTDDKDFFDRFSTPPTYQVQPGCYRRNLVQCGTKNTGKNKKEVAGTIEMTWPWLERLPPECCM